MSDQGYTPAGYPPAGFTPAAATSSALPPEGFRQASAVPLIETARPAHRYWLHALLLILTLLTTTVVGAGLAHSFTEGRPFDFDDFRGYQVMWHNPAYLLDGLPFSLTLLLILLAHEMGHYLAARYYHVDATLPFFLPAPTLIGTFGAFIRIRSAILRKRILFDIGIAGPLAGFVVLLIPLIAGVSMSRVIHRLPEPGELLFGTPYILRAFEWLSFSKVPAMDIVLHPVARAAWVGLLATSLNLLPIGQLDGGHILYSFLGERTRISSRLFVIALAGLGGFQLFTSGFKIGFMWLLWAVVLFFLGMRHPAIVDPTPLGQTRSWLGFAALIIFLLTFTAAPIGIAGS